MAEGRRGEGFTTHREQFLFFSSVRATPKNHVEYASELPLSRKEDSCLPLVKGHPWDSLTLLHFLANHRYGPRKSHSSGKSLEAQKQGLSTLR